MDDGHLMSDGDRRVDKKEADARLLAAVERLLASDKERDHVYARLLATGVFQTMHDWICDESCTRESNPRDSLNSLMQVIAAVIGSHVKPEPLPGNKRALAADICALLRFHLNDVWELPTRGGIAINARPKEKR